MVGTRPRSPMDTRLRMVRGMATTITITPTSNIITTITMTTTMTAPAWLPGQVRSTPPRGRVRRVVGTMVRVRVTVTAMSLYPPLARARSR